MSQAHPLQHTAAAARAGNTALAKIHLQKAAEADPDDPAVWLWMGWLSDSPMSMVQSLEMLLDNEQFRPVAEAGICFAQSLNGFRYGHDIRTVTTANSVSSPIAASVQPVSVPAEQGEPPAADPSEPDEILDPVPEIVFDEPSEPHALNEQPEALDTFDTVPSQAGFSDSSETYQCWSSEWAPDFTNDEPDPAIESAVEQPELTESVVERRRPEPLGDPEGMFRPARTDWFSTGGTAEDHVDTHRTHGVVPTLLNSVKSQISNILPQQAASFGFDSVRDKPTETDTASRLPSAPVSPNNAPALNDGVQQPAYESPAPVWQRPANTRASGRGSSYEPPAVREESSDSAASAIRDAAAGSYSESPSLSGPATPAITTILVVDDSPTVRKLVAMTLEKRGYRVVTAFDGVAAMKEIAAQHPALILMDVNMPRLDGYQLCKLVKQHDSTRHIPVIMLSGKDGMFDRLRGRLVGCAGYISKPFVPESLVETVDQYLAQATSN